MQDLEGIITLDLKNKGTVQELNIVFNRDILRSNNTLWMVLPFSKLI